MMDKKALESLDFLLFALNRNQSPIIVQTQDGVSNVAVIADFGFFIAGFMDRKFSLNFEANGHSVILNLVLQFIVNIVWLKTFSFLKVSSFFEQTRLN